MTKIRTYKELRQLETFEERYEYLRLNSESFKETFGYDRYLNQRFYKSREWKEMRDYVISRDNGCDLGVPEYEIRGPITVHHMNPITKEEILHSDDNLLDPNSLITVSFRTHNAIHYGDETQVEYNPIVRLPGDTKLW